jgi:iron complex transport system substrate-binding protein
MTNNLRIVSLLPSATEIVCALGLEDYLVGITHECDYPSSVATKPKLTSSHISHESMTSAQIDHAVRRQLDGHGSIYSLNEDLLHSLSPTLILTQELCEVCAVSYSTVQQAARRMNGDATVISLEPKSIKDILLNIELVGELTGYKERASKLIAGLIARLERIESALNNLQYRPRTLMLEWLDPLFAPGHWVPEQVALAGGNNSFGNLAKPSTTTTIQEIIDYGPEIIVLIPCGYYKEDILRALSQVQMPEGWKSLPAVKEGHVWAVDATSYFSRPGPRTIDGVEILAKILHPTIFGTPNEKEAIRVPSIQ